MVTQDERSQTSSSIEGAFCYAVVDLASAAALRPVVPNLMSSVAEPLLARSMAPQVLAVGPWLVDLAQVPEVARTLTAWGSSVPWGYYVYSRVDIVSVRQSLRKFNLARVEGSKTDVLFRYWDPRVIRVFLHGTTNAQRAKFLDWIDRVEWADGSFLDKAEAADADR
ncbi:MAG: DUF4123 domain-containing protein [bacterium]